jgi:hypothetical protein
MSVKKETVTTVLLGLLVTIITKGALVRAL